jgi:hypothetical protein
MYKMRAEHQSTETGTTRIWHVLDHGGEALCCQLPDPGTASLACDDSPIPESYCAPCLDAVAVATTSVAPSTPDPVIPSSALPEEPPA